MRHLATAAFLAVLAAARPSGAVRSLLVRPEMSASLCRVPQTALFTCKVGTKVVSICGQPQGGAVYRFGRQGHVELEIADLHRTQESFSGGGETQVYADTPSHRYIVYDEIVRTGFGPDGHNDPQAESGLLVQRGGKIVSSRTCSEPTAFSLLIEKLLPMGEYVPH